MDLERRRESTPEPILVQRDRRPSRPRYAVLPDPFTFMSGTLRATWCRNLPTSCVNSLNIVILCTSKLLNYFTNLTNLQHFAPVGHLVVFLRLSYQIH